MLDKASPIPLYYQLQSVIRQQILSGKVSPGERLPTLQEMAQQFDVSLTVVRQAVRRLEQEGNVRVQQGRGIFASQPSQRYALDLLSPQFYETAAQMGLRLSLVCPVREAIQATPEISEKLKIGPDSPVIHMLKIRLANRIPTMIAEAYFPYNACPALVDPVLTPEEINSLLEEEIYHHITHSETWASATTASLEIASHLEISPGDPLLEFEGLSIGPDDNPIQYYLAKVVSYRLRMGIEIKKLELHI